MTPTSPVDRTADPETTRAEKRKHQGAVRTSAQAGLPAPAGPDQEVLRARVRAALTGSDFRRLVAQEKTRWRQAQAASRGTGPAVWAAGEHLVIDWGVQAGLHVFCAVLAFSRVRFVRFADNERRHQRRRRRPGRARDARRSGGPASRSMRSWRSGIVYETPPKRPAGCDPQRYVAWFSQRCVARPLAAPRMTILTG